jgi:hypothetical protein
LGAEAEKARVAASKSFGSSVSLKKGAGRMMGAGGMHRKVEQFPNQNQDAVIRY